MSRRAVRFLLLLTLAVVLGVQSVRVIERNVAVSHEVQAEDEQITILQTRKADELRAIARLQRPDGAIPEIHNRLKYAADNEAVVFVHHPGDGENAMVGP